MKTLFKRSLLMILILGIAGNFLTCVDAETGKAVWKSSTHDLLAVDLDASGHEQ